MPYLFSRLLRSRWRAAMMVLLLFLSCYYVDAQAPQWQQPVIPTQATGNSSEITATASDADGNIYAVGLFTGTITFSATTLTASGANDIFITKWQPSTRTFLWAYRAGGANREQVTAVVVSGSNVYIAGSFYGTTATFGSIILTNRGPLYNDDVYVAKLVDAGSMAQFSWAVQAGGPGRDQTDALVVEGSALYVAGSFYSVSATFGSAIVSNAGFGTNDGFVARLDDTGSTSNFAWVQRLGGSDEDEVTALAVTGSQVYLGGNFKSLVSDFGPFSRTPYGDSDLFVARLTDAGTSSSFDWVEQAGGGGQDGLATLKAQGGNLYIGGHFQSDNAYFGLFTLSNPTTTYASESYVAKLTDVGNGAAFVWAQQGHGTYDQITDLVVSGTHIYVSGWFGGPSVTFGPCTVQAQPLDTDLFIGHLTDAGLTANFTWLKSARSNNRDLANSLALHGTSICVAGQIGLPAFFDSYVVTGPAPPATGSCAFLVTLTDQTLATASAARLTDWSLAPNPASKATRLFVSALFAGQLACLSLYSSLGQKVWTETFTISSNGTSRELSLLNLAPGVYSAQLSAGKAVATKRLLIE